MTERKSLADAFKAPQPATGSDRAKGLAGILPTRKTPDVPALTDDTPSASVTQRAEAKTPSDQGRTQPAPALGNDRVRNVGSYLEPEIMSALQARTRLEDQQYADILLDAFDAVSEDELRAIFSPSVPAVEAGRAPRRASTTRPLSGPKMPLNYRLTGEQTAWIDNIGKIVAAPSRTALCNAVLRKYLL